MTFLESNLLITSLFLSGAVWMLGACIASFLMVVSYRSGKKLSWVRGRSFCEQCRKQLSWWQNIPIVSYLMLGGRCHYCHGRIQQRYFWWELLLGGWTVVWFWAELMGAMLIGGQVLVGRAWLMLPLGAILIWVSLEDIRTQEIENKWLWWLAGLAAARVGLYVTTGTVGLVELGQQLGACLGVGFGFWLLDKVSLKVLKKPGLGSGDAWMAAIMCWWLTPSQTVIWLLSSFWLGAAVGVTLIWLKKTKPRRWRDKSVQTVPFLPFLVSGFMIAWFWGESLFGVMFGG